MPSAVRKDDLCSGHEAYPPRPIKKGSSNVFVNNRQAARANDELEIHMGYLGENPHPATIKKDTPLKSTVFINGRGAVIIKAKMNEGDCTSIIITGSGDVFYEEIKGGAK